MKSRPILNKALFILALITITAANLRDFYLEKKVEPTEEHLLAILPNAASFSPERGEPPRYEGYSSPGEKLVGAAYLTDHLPPRVVGYVDTIDLLVGMDREGTITGVELLRDKESPAYMQMLREEDFLSLFTGLKIQDGLEEVDAVTGATISSESIIKDIRTSSNLIAEKVFGIEVAGEEEVVSPIENLFQTKVYLLIGVLAWGLLAFFVRGIRYGRQISLGLGLVFLGFYLQTPLTMDHLVNLLHLHLPSLSNPILLILLLFALLTSLFFGNIYCSCLCPYGALMDFLSRLFPKRMKVSPHLWKSWGRIRYYLLFAIIILCFGAGLKAFASLEPFLYLFSLNAVSFIWLYIALTIGFSVVLPRFWCRVLCPTGALLNILSSFRRKRKDIFDES